MITSFDGRHGIRQHRRRDACEGTGPIGTQCDVTVLRRRLAGTPKNRATVSARQLGWLYSDWRCRPTPFRKRNNHRRQDEGLGRPVRHRKPIGGSWRSTQQERSDLFDRLTER